MLFTSRRFFPLALLFLAFGCGGDSGTDPGDDTPTPGTLDFDSDLVNLFQTRSTSVNLVNGTAAPVGPVGFRVGATFDETGVDVRGVRGNALPPTVPTIRPGGEASVSVNLNDFGLPPGTYETVFEARVDGVTRASVRLRFEINQGTPSSAVSVEITEGPTQLVQGDPVNYVADPRNSRDEQLPPAFVEWFVLPTHGGQISQDGRFVPYLPGPARIIARSGIQFDTLEVNVAPRAATGSLTLVGQTGGAGAQDLHAAGDFAYLAGSDGTLRTVNISDPASPTVVSELAIDAERIPSVHVREDGTLGVVAHIGSADGLNGVTLLDMTDPAAPAAIGRYTTGMGTGVVGVFLEGDFLYVAINNGGMAVIDVTDPANPATVGGFLSGSSFASDVEVEDGVAFLSYFNAGSLVLDVGGGAAGGSPAAPALIGTLNPQSGQIASTTYWSRRGLGLLVEADDLGPGVLHVVDASTLSANEAVATWAVDGTPPAHAVAHGTDDRIFAAWHTGGVRMLDATGTLEGDLEQQGREVATATYGSANPDAVRVSLVGDLVLVADADAGLVILRAGG